MLCVNKALSTTLRLRSIVFKQVEFIIIIPTSQEGSGELHLFMKDAQGGAWLT